MAEAAIVVDNDFLILSDIEHVRKRCGMYVGDTSGNPNSLLSEVMDNALDESLNNHANKITIVVDNESGDRKSVV